MIFILYFAFEIYSGFISLFIPLEKVLLDMIRPVGDLVKCLLLSGENLNRYM